MIGYKMLNKDMSAKFGNMIYEIGKVYEIDKEIKLGRRGYHFCDNFTDCLIYYHNMKNDKRLFKVDTLDGEIVKENKRTTGSNGNVYNHTKYCSSKIKLIEEVKIDDVFLEDLLKNENEDWSYIISLQKLSEEFIEKHYNKFHWSELLKYQKFSEEFLEKHLDNNKIDWLYVSIYQDLSEDFIYSHDDKLNIECIIITKNVNEAFLEKHWANKNVNWEHVINMVQLPEKFLDNHWDELAPLHSDIINNQKLSGEFIENHGIILH